MSYNMNYFVIYYILVTYKFWWRAP